METRKIFRLLGSLAIMVSFSAWLPAQTFELNPYAGGILGSGSVDTGAGSFDLKDQGIFGVRGAYFLTGKTSRLRAISGTSTILNSKGVTRKAGAISGRQVEATGLISSRSSLF